MIFFFRFFFVWKFSEHWRSLNRTLFVILVISSVRFMRTVLPLHECEWFDLLKTKSRFSTENTKRKISFRTCLTKFDFFSMKFSLEDVWSSSWPVDPSWRLNLLDLTPLIVGEIWSDLQIHKKQKNRVHIYSVLDSAQVNRFLFGFYIDNLISHLFQMELEMLSMDLIRRPVHNAKFLSFSVRNTVPIRPVTTIQHVVWSNHML